MYNHIPDSVNEITKWNMIGNVIPHEWYKHIKFDNGKTDMNAIIILSEIVYWHRATVTKDEATGEVLGVKKKFKADLLQRSYESFSNQFGITKRQATDAVKRLEDKGLITRVLRNINVSGQNLYNVLFIKVHHEELKKITFPQVASVETYEVSPQNVIGSTEGRDTNTKITQKNTQEIKRYKKRYIIGKTADGYVLNYYAMKFKLHYGREHPTVTKEQLKNIKYVVEEVTDVHDITDSEWRTLIDEYFYDLDKDNTSKGSALYFFNGDGMQGVVVRYIKGM